MHIQHFFDDDTATFTYIVIDPQTNHCAIIDPVLDFNLHTGQVGDHSAKRIIEYVQSHELKVQWILETHAHADHITAAQWLKQKLGGQIAIGAHIQEVLTFWVPIFNIQHDTSCNGTQFDVLFHDGDEFSIGNLPVRVLHTPGHTPACVTYCVGDAAFVGDTLFMPYVGTARTDFPGGSASTLYQSIQKLLALPDHTRLFTGHDYPPTGNPPACQSTVAEQKASNIMVRTGISEQTFVHNRNAKDQGKAPPRLLLPSIQINLRAGSLGQAESNGKHYVKIPIKTA